MPFNLPHLHIPSLTLHLALSAFNSKYRILHLISFLHTSNLQLYLATNFLRLINKSKLGRNVYLSSQAAQILHHDFILSCISNRSSLTTNSIVTVLIWWALNSTSDPLFLMKNLILYLVRKKQISLHKKC